jgi:Tol biopolymer transport system component
MATGNFRVKFSPPTQNLTIKNNSTLGVRLDSLVDVNPATSANGSILVYDSSNDTYVQRDILTFDQETGAFKLDAGDDGF